MFQLSSPEPDNCYAAIGLDKCQLFVSKITYMDQRWLWDLDCGSQISYIAVSHMIKETWSFIHFGWFPPTALFFFSL